MAYSTLEGGRVSVHRMAQQLQDKGPGNKVLQATSIVELDAKMGPGSLDRRAFDNLIQRFAEQVGVPSGEVSSLDVFSTGTF